VTAHRRRAGEAAALVVGHSRTEALGSTDQKGTRLAHSSLSSRAFGVLHCTIGSRHMATSYPVCLPRSRGMAVALVVLALLITPSLGDVGLTCYGPKSGAKNHSYCHVGDIPSWCCKRADGSVFKVCPGTVQSAKGGSYIACSCRAYQAGALSVLTSLSTAPGASSAGSLESPDGCSLWVMYQQHPLGDVSPACCHVSQARHPTWHSPQQLKSSASHALWLPLSTPPSRARPAPACPYQCVEYSIPKTKYQVCCVNSLALGPPCC
jgi:hypothetical protein